MMKNLILALVLCFISASLIAQISPIEKEALLDFYASTNGDKWTISLRPKQV